MPAVAPEKNDQSVGSRLTLPVCDLISPLARPFGKLTVMTPAPPKMTVSLVVDVMWPLSSAPSLPSADAVTLKGEKLLGESTSAWEYAQNKMAFLLGKDGVNALSRILSALGGN